MDLRAMDLRAMELRPHVRILLGHSSFVGLSMFHRDHTATPLSFGKKPVGPYSSSVLSLELSLRAGCTFRS